MNITTALVDYEAALSSVTNGRGEWVIIGAINFEERSIRVLTDVLTASSDKSSSRIIFKPFRLYSKRTSPWSALELVKNRLQEDLWNLAKSRGIELSVREVEYPVTQDVAHMILSQSRQSGVSGEQNLLLDISALPTHLAVYLCDAIVLHNTHFRLSPFKRILVVDTPPEKATSRDGLGPFTVGAPVCVYHPRLLRNIPDNLKISALIFPGGEGFEAKATVDEIAGHNAHITIAFPGLCDAFPSAGDDLVANQALLADAAAGEVDIQFYFSELDALRVFLDIVERAAQICMDFPFHQHSFLVATFGGKWPLILGAIARSVFLARAKELVPDAALHTDVVTLPTAQYVSLFSRGSRSPRVFELFSSLNQET